MSTQNGYQYRNLLQAIIDNGRTKSDRTGVGTRSIFGYQTRWDLSEGFPLETTKFTAFRIIAEELLWFIRGSSDAMELIEKNAHIWDAWMVPEDIYDEVPLKEWERAKLWRQQSGMSESEINLALGNDLETGHRRMDEAGVPRTKSVLRVKKGELGPVYGVQWRSWSGPRGEKIDQLKEAIELLKTKPTSRRIIVSAWNPADLPDESKKPHVNAAEGRMALAACHTMFQFMAEPLTLLERNLRWYDRNPELKKNLDDLPGPTVEEYLTFCIEDQTEEQRASMIRQLDEDGIPKYRLSCQLYQRSADVFLGAPFNIASYALLTHMVAQCVNMVPGDFVHTFGDAHLYLNHFEVNGAEEGVETLLQREPKPYPTLRLNPAITDIDQFTMADIKIENYKYHPSIKAPVAV